MPSRMSRSVVRDGRRLARLPSREEYRVEHLKAMAEEERKFNAKFGTHDVRYQNAYNRLPIRLRRKYA